MIGHKNSLIIAILAVISMGVVGALLWHTSSPTLGVQEYTFNQSGPIYIYKVYYVPYPTNGATYGGELVVQMSTFSGANVILSQTTDGARTWEATSIVTVTHTPTWFEIPGTNCLYSDDNGRLQTIQISTSVGIVQLSYYCIYPPVVTQVTFPGLVTANWSDGHGTIVP